MAKHIETGTAAPATTPTDVGQHFIDTTGSVGYVAVGTSTSADWKETTGGGGFNGATVTDHGSTTSFTITMDEAVEVHTSNSSGPVITVTFAAPTDPTVAWRKVWIFRASGPSSTPVIAYSGSGTNRITDGSLSAATYHFVEVFWSPDSTSFYTRII